MPAKFGNTTVNTTTYVALDATVNGACSITINNPAGIGIRIAGEAASAPAIGTTAYTLIATNSGGVYTFRANPSQTWLLADSGGGALQWHLNW